MNNSFSSDLVNYLLTMIVLMWHLSVGAQTYSLNKDSTQDWYGIQHSNVLIVQQYLSFNSLRPSNAYMRRWTNHHWFWWWLVACPAQNHYLNQFWNIVNWTLRNKLQWNFNRNSNIFIQENALENVVCGMASILSLPQCVRAFKTLCKASPLAFLWQESAIFN